MSDTNINLIALQTASEAFASKRIPDDWEDMTYDEQKEWLDDHRWAHFEDDTTDSFFALIDTHADNVKQAIKLALVELKEKLIEAAIEGTLPDDFNDLDLKAMLDLN